MIDCTMRRFQVTCPRCGMYSIQVYGQRRESICCPSCHYNLFDKVVEAVDKYKQQIKQAGNLYTKFRGYKACKGKQK